MTENLMQKNMKKIMLKMRYLFKNGETTESKILSFKDCIFEGLNYPKDIYNYLKNQYEIETIHNDTYTRVYTKLRDYNKLIQEEEIAPDEFALAAARMLEAIQVDTTLIFSIPESDPNNIYAAAMFVDEDGISYIDNHGYHQGIENKRAVKKAIEENIEDMMVYQVEENLF